MSDDIFVNLNGKLVKITSGSGLTIATHRCARCNATLDEASVEGHVSRCFIVGDWLRLDCSTDGRDWVEGPVVTLRGDDGHAAISPERASRGMRHRAGGSPFTFNLKNLDGIRHIQRPGQAVRDTAHSNCRHEWIGDMCMRGGTGCSGRPCDADCKKCEVERGATVGQYREPHVLSVKVTGYTSKPITVTKQELDDARDNPLGLYERAAGLPPPERKFDGMTEEQCSVRWEINRHHVERGLPAPSAMTVKQIAAAKAAWVRDVGMGQSAQLRARIAAARERDRLTVTLDLAEDE